jgi:hypothetical protein
MLAVVVVIRRPGHLTSEEPMSAPVITSLTAAGLAGEPAESTVPTRRAPAALRRTVAGGRLSPVTGARPAVPRTEVPVADGSGSTPDQVLANLGDPDSLVVTITLGVSGSGRRDRVLTALRQLIAAAGPDSSVSSTAVAPPAVSLIANPVPRPRAALAPVSGSPAGVPLRLDPGPRTAQRGGWPLDLSRLEYDLLLFLARHPRQVFTRAQLLAQVWGHTHTSPRTVDVHISRLRTKLGAESGAITTVYGLGYRLADDAPIDIVDR